MRYPVGFRPTWAEAFEAALESSRMTGLHYMVAQLRSTMWAFRPDPLPLPRHEGVRV